METNTNSLFTFYRINIIFTIASIFICLNKHTYSNAPYFTVPIAYVLCLIFLRRYQQYENQLSIRIIESIMIIRYVLMPISYYCLDSSPTSFDIHYANVALFFIIYEMVVVFLVLNVFCKRIFDSLHKGMVLKTEASFSDIGVKILLFLFVATLAMYPQYLHNLITFSFETLESVEVESDVNGMFNLIYKSGSIVFSCLLISKFRVNNGRISSLLICLLTSWLCTWLCSLGTSGLVSRTSFLTNGIIFTMMVLKYYPQYKRGIITFSVSIVLSMLILGTISRFYVDKDTSSFWMDMLAFEMLDSYFGGLRDVIVAIKMDDLYGDKLGLTTFFNDLFAGAPYFASRSGMDFDMRSSYFFNATFFGMQGFVSRICPLIGQGYSYFGPLLAPIPTSVCVLSALRLNRKLNDSADTISFYMYCLMMYFFSAYAMYNMNIIAGGFWNKVLPILLVVILNNWQKKIISQ